ncbi:glycosyltransferase family 2 protein [Actinoalloteichus hymeniacidonis]|uniref:Glycosyl transferase family 2 n=1 Tax=Actinoalloteichus hymeniacidonis TaxID=340345 RepID=A0AAC9HV37_9PSEU|nr:glycosyltransferase [Actinoalloteichus hymeniacidonis]AOS65904.1 Glycosyl transferase family 2 [Actinoalloteichus hymeniacidonis]MBB5906000.1 glycosyltransferase involved in cell wall biosynthesis [Actinoalloteichus hymeniacidonis]
MPPRTQPAARTAGLIGRACPPVTVGLPVFNGESYLERALDSLTGQVDVDFELHVADNHSTDATEEICRSYAAADDRIRYIRRGHNIGVMANHNRLVEQSRSPFFAWAGADDLWLPHRLARCLEALRGNPAAVLASTSATEIDTEDQPIGSWHNRCRIEHSDPVTRLYDLVSVEHHNYYCYGLIRRSVLVDTMLNPPIKAGDRVLIAELALRGPFVDIPEQLLLHRIHPDRISQRVGPREFYRSQCGDSARSIVLPNVEEGRWFLRAVLRSPLLPKDRARALYALRPWLRSNAVPMARNLARAAVDSARLLADTSRGGPRS